MIMFPVSYNLFIIYSVYKILKFQIRLSITFKSRQINLIQRDPFSQFKMKLLLMTLRLENYYFPWQTIELFVVQKCDYLNSFESPWGKSKQYLSTMLIKANLVNENSFRLEYKINYSQLINQFSFLKLQCISIYKCK